LSSRYYSAAAQPIAIADPWKLVRLLRARRNRPCFRAAEEQPDQVASSYYSVVEMIVAEAKRRADG
jgi:hypothetical protein